MKGSSVLVAGFPAGPWGTNCYVAAQSAGQECVIVDPGKDSADGIADLVKEHRLKPIAVLLTHGHIDHMWSVVPVADGYGVPALVHGADRALLTDPAAGISADTREALSRMVGDTFTFVEPAEVIDLASVTEIDLAGISWRVDHAPGHTPGSVTFSRGRTNDMPPLMFSGDVLFAGSIGRTDLPGGDTDAMMKSLGRVMLPLDDDTVVLPGHGEQTTIGQERRSNPYLQSVASGVNAPDPKSRGL